LAGKRAILGAEKVMIRWICLFAATLMGLLLVACGFLVPMHIRAVDASVLHAAGSQTQTLARKAMELVNARKLGAAQMLLRSAHAEGLPEREIVGDAADKIALHQPHLQFWGGPEPSLKNLVDIRESTPEPFTDFIVRSENRQQALDFLQDSNLAGAYELLLCRELTNTVIFPPSWTSSGQAFDAAIAISGLLMADAHFRPSFSNELFTLAYRANRGDNPHRLEQALLDVMSLGQRLNWGQLAVLVQHLEDVETARLLTTMIHNHESDLPHLYSAVVLLGDARPVTRYGMNFSETGTRDIRAAMHYGAGGLNELVKRNKRLRHSPVDQLLVNYMPFYYLTVLSWRAPIAALLLKWLFFGLGGYLLAAAVHQYLIIRSARFEVFSQNKPFAAPPEHGRTFDLPPVRGFNVARQTLFALGFLLVVLLFSEPFLASESQKMDAPFRLKLPTVVSMAPTGPTVANSSIMNQLSLLTLLLFFVIQSLIYTACLFKLAEIRRQQIGPRMKLKLLENEDHLFDAGLYLGFVGTIISLILVSLGVIKPSLMAAYSSTSFGIIFVSVFKIFNLRPVRRRLLLEAEAQVRYARLTTPEETAVTARPSPSML
jgi:hypothetical protein